MKSLLRVPHFEFIVDAPPTQVAPFEYLLPGALVYGFVAGVWGVTPRTARARYSPLDREATYLGTSEPPQSRIMCPADGGYIVARELQARGFSFRVDKRADVPNIDRRDPSEYIETGREALAALVTAGWLREGWDKGAFDFQAEIAGRTAKGLSAILLRWECGAGKTIAALMMAMVVARQHQGAVVAAVKSVTRPGWGADVVKCSHKDVFVCMPVSSGGGGLALMKYLDECKSKGAAPFIVVGHDLLGQWVNILQNINPVAIILDEIDSIAPTPDKYRDLHYDREGGLTVTQSRTTKTKRLSKGAAFTLLTQLESVKVRIGLTATPVDSGIPKKWWAVANLLTPGAYGMGTHQYLVRHCGGRKDGNGYMCYPEATHVTDLKMRASFLLHNVTKEESHASLKPMNYKLVTVRKEDQQRSATQSRYSKELTWNSAIRKCATMRKSGSASALIESDGGALESTSSHELTLMYCCAIKRTAITTDATDACLSGQRVVITVGRKREARLWAEHCRKELKRRTPDGLPVPVVRVCDGEVPTSERYKRVAKWRTEPAGILIITQHAMGTGVDGMQVADLVLIGMLPSTTQPLVQLLGRFDRHGRENVCTIRIYVAKGTADENKLKELAEGYDFFGRFLDDTNYSAMGELLHNRDDKKTVVKRLLACIN